MGNIQLVPALFGEDHFIIVKHFESECTLYFQRQLLSILKKTNVEAGHDVVSLRKDNLFFKNNAILPGLIAICPFHRLCAHNLIKTKVVSTRLNIDLDLAFCCVVRHDTLNDYDVTEVVLIET